MKNNQYTVEEVKQFILANIKHYDSFEEYLKLNNTSLEDYEESKADGFVQDITCGVFSGATGEFTPRKMSDGSVVDAILQEVGEGCLYETLEDFTEGTRLIDYALTYTELYKVFTIGDYIYVVLD